jgi:hypothetical protein
MRIPVNDNNEKYLWLCNCGCPHFYVHQKGFECVDCGTIQNFGELEI